MSTAIWGESETQSDENYPLSLLKNLLQQMMEQFTGQGACLALYDENIRQMVIRLHLRAPISSPASADNNIEDIVTVPLHPRKASSITRPLNPSASALGRMRRLSKPLPPLDPVTLQPLPSHTTLFSLGEAYTFGQGLIGTTWRKNEPIILRSDEYTAAHPIDGQPLAQNERVPACYFAIPIQDPPMLSPQSTQSVQPMQPPTQRPQNMLGVIVLYQTFPGA